MQPSLRSYHGKDWLAPAAISMFILTAAASLMACNPATGSPPPSAQGNRIPRIGYLTPVGADQRSPSKEAFVQALKELGYLDGETISIEYRTIAEGEEAKLPERAQELAQLPLDAIVALGTARVQAAKDATQTTPIVMASTVDPVEAGLVASLSRPEANVTGVATLSAALAGKRLELLKEAVPSISRVAILATPRWNIPNSSTGLQWRGTQEAAAVLGLDLHLVEARDEGSGDATVAGIDRAVASASELGADALVPLADALFDIRRPEVAASANARRLPTIYSRGDFADSESGGLMGHGPDLLDSFRKVATYVDRIIKGARPDALPVEQPDRYDLIVNVKTAEALGLTFPESILIQATRVVR